MVLYIKTKHENISSPADIADEIKTLSDATGINKSQLYTILVIEGLKRYNKGANTQSTLYRNADKDRAKIRAHYKKCNQ